VREYSVYDAVVRY